MPPFAADYLAAFRAHAGEPGEATLRAAYELGREAVRRDLGILDVAIAHHDALLAMAAGGMPHAADRAIRAGAEFFVETLSAFEMVRRGFLEARDAVQMQRRQADMLRELSSFLADAELTLDATDAQEEMLMLVAEQARELVPADCCLVTIGATPQTHARASSHREDDDRRWRTFVRWADISAIEEAVRSAPRAAILGGAELDERIHPRPGGSVGEAVVRNWLGSRLVRLDGHEMGCIHLANRADGEFTTLDEATLVHLAQIAAAAIERVQFYAEREIGR